MTKSLYIHPLRACAASSRVLDTHPGLPCFPRRVVCLRAILSALAYLRHHPVVQPPTLVPSLLTPRPHAISAYFLTHGFNARSLPTVRKNTTVTEYPYADMLATRWLEINALARACDARVELAI
jgi:hypothetical protein